MKKHIKKLLDNITGKKEEFLSRYSRLYEKGNLEEIVMLRKKTILQRYVIIAAAGVVMLFAVTAQHYEEASNIVVEDGSAKAVIRSADRSYDYEFKVKVKGEEEAQSVIVHIEPKSDEASETQEDKTETAEETETEAENSVDYNALADAVSESPARNQIVLPAYTEDGRAVSWNCTRDYTWLIIIAATAAIFIAIYRSRFEKVEKEEKDAQSSVLLELPSFINKNILLLNGGLVLTDAFERIVTEHQKNGESGNYFYERLNEIYINSREANIPVEVQLSDFARNSGVREFIRVAAVISDNICKGTSLTESLESESDYLWFSRKKKAEELGRLAETKMTFPLVILLVILIMITIAPAMLEM